MPFSVYQPIATYTTTINDLKYHAILSTTDISLNQLLIIYPIVKYPNAFNPVVNANGRGNNCLWINIPKDTRTMTHI